MGRDRCGGCGDAVPVSDSWVRCTPCENDASEVESQLRADRDKLEADLATLRKERDALNLVRQRVREALRQIDSRNDCHANDARIERLCHYALTELGYGYELEGENGKLLPSSAWTPVSPDYEPREGDWLLADFPHQGVTRFAVTHDFEYRRATILPHVLAYYRPPAPPEVPK